MPLNPITVRVIVVYPVRLMICIPFSSPYHLNPSSLDKSLPFSLSNVAVRQEISSLSTSTSILIERTIYAPVVAEKAKRFRSSLCLNNIHKTTSFFPKAHV
jgi:hypothetical protein